VANITSANSIEPSADESASLEELVGRLKRMLPANLSNQALTTETPPSASAPAGVEPALGLTPISADQASAVVAEALRPVEEAQRQQAAALGHEIKTVSDAVSRLSQQLDAVLAAGQGDILVRKLGALEQTVAEKVVAPILGLTHLVEGLGVDVSGRRKRRFGWILLGTVVGFCLGSAAGLWALPYVTHWIQEALNRLP